MSYACSGALLYRSPFRWLSLLIPPAVLVAAGLVGIFSNGTMAGIAVLVAVAGLIPFVALSTFRENKGRIEADPDGIRFDGKLVASRSRGAWGAVLSGREHESSRLAIMTRRGALALRFAVSDRHGRALLAAAQLDIAQSRCELRLFPGSSSTRWLMAFFIGQMLLGLHVLPVVFFFVDGPSFESGCGVAVLLAAFFMLVDTPLWLLYKWLFIRVRIGEEGIWVKRYGRVRLLRFSDIADVRLWASSNRRVLPEGFDLILSDGEVIRFPTSFARARAGQLEGDFVLDEITRLTTEGEKPVPASQGLGLVALRYDGEARLVMRLARMREKIGSFFSREHWSTVLFGGWGLFQAFFFVVWSVLALQARPAREWPTVSGRVVSTDIRHERVCNTSSSAAAVGCEDRYWPKVAYEYELSGFTHRAEGVDFEPVWRTNKREVEILIAKYPIGLRVRPHCKPDTPPSCYLEIKPPGAYMSVIAQSGWLALAFFLVSLMLHFLWRRHRYQRHLDLPADDN